jgi:hypothetical protein
MMRLLSKLPTTKQFLNLVVLVAATAVIVSTATAGDDLPSQDQALTRALENHPDIVAAKAKVALAEAELYGKRIEVSRQVLGLYGSLKILDAQIDASMASVMASKKDLEQTKQNGVADNSTTERLAADVHAAEEKMVKSKAERERSEKELRLLIGTLPTITARVPGEAPTAHKHPQGPVVDKMKAALQKPIRVSFAEAPLQDVLSYYSDATGIMFSAQRQALEAIGLDAATPISLTTNEVSLEAVLQGFEDAYPELQFILRDYGVLVTTKDYAMGVDYMPVLKLDEDSATTTLSR